MAVTLDTGALILADRDDRRFWRWWARAAQLHIVPTVPAPVIAQAWRGGARQANLARVLRVCRLAPMDGVNARRTGALCAIARMDDVVDAFVALGAADRGDDIFTTDPDDLQRLLAAAGGRGRVFTADDL